MSKNAKIAGVLSFIIPGVGQLYNGTYFRAALWIALTPVLWIGSAGLFGWICHAISAYTAAKYRDKKDLSEYDHLF